MTPAPARLVLGPLLRFVGDDEATLWVETDRACKVEVLGCSSPTFCVAGHYYGFVRVSGLEPGAYVPYDVHLDGERRWPLADSPFPASVIRTRTPGQPLHLAFGSCRVSLPHEPPYTLSKDRDDRGREVDAPAPGARPAPGATTSSDVLSPACSALSLAFVGIAGPPLRPECSPAEHMAPRGWGSQVERARGLR